MQSTPRELAQAGMARVGVGVGPGLFEIAEIAMAAVKLAAENILTRDHTAKLERSVLRCLARSGAREAASKSRLGSI